MDARPGGIWGVLATHDEDIAARFTDCVPMGHERAPTLTDLNSVDGFLFVDTNYWTDVTPSLLEAALAERPRPMVVCNPDVACPYGDRISAEPGFYAHMLAARGLADVTFLGKPFRGVYDLVGQRFPNVARERMLMVGDSPHTDVLGARGAGMNVLLVECGFLARTGQSRAVPGGRAFCRISSQQRRDDTHIRRKGLHPGEPPPNRRRSV